MIGREPKVCAGFDGLMVMISVSHQYTEGSQFDPGSSHSFLFFHSNHPSPAPAAWLQRNEE